VSKLENVQNGIFKIKVKDKLDVVVTYDPEMNLKVFVTTKQRLPKTEKDANDMIEEFLIYFNEELHANSVQNYTTKDVRFACEKDFLRVGSAGHIYEITSFDSDGINCENSLSFEWCELEKKRVFPHKKWES